MAKCGDCLFYIPGYGESYCNKTRRSADSDDYACSDFLHESHRCCYDCEKLRISNDFCVARFRVINKPGSYYCDSFKYEV